MSSQHDNFVEFKDLPPHREKDIQAFLNFCHAWLVENPNGSLIREVKSMDFAKRQKLATEAVNLFNKHGYKELLSLKFVRAILRTAAVYIDSLPPSSQDTLPPGWHRIAHMYADASLPVITSHLLQGYIKGYSAHLAGLGEVRGEGRARIPAVAIRGLEEQIRDARRVYKDKYGRNPEDRVGEQSLRLRVSREQLKTIPQTLRRVADIEIEEKGMSGVAIRQVQSTASTNVKDVRFLLPGSQVTIHPGSTSPTPTPKGTGNHFSPDVAPPSVSLSRFPTDDLLGIITNLQQLHPHAQVHSSTSGETIYATKLNIRAQNILLLTKFDVFITQNLAAIARISYPTMTSLGVIPEIQEAIHSAFEDDDVLERIEGMS
ncbi:hypothetical protein BDN72DRAFT_906287 [Pluteus cervinus]|uniref:Uncharacterized protein n=1 Tax=Pluteus cervinus TaxID=181527 RepID=A0ACD2ZZT3_9AGAR|nr:hypothetical protein BDN72DRAFT_906287 [Pluteus cervinus]